MKKNELSIIKKVSTGRSHEKVLLKYEPTNVAEELRYQKIIETSDLDLAAFLRSKYQLKIVRMKKDSTGRLSWSFELLDKDENFLVNQFYAGETVSAIDYASEIKRLKASVYNV